MTDEDGDSLSKSLTATTSSSWKATTEMCRKAAYNAMYDSYKELINTIASCI